MRKFTLVMAGLLAVSTLAVAQKKKEKKDEGYQFTDVVRLDCTPVKSQDNAGTCWSWSGNSFLESEMIRLGKKPVEIAPLFTVWNAYSAKAEKYVRLHGKCNFSQGGAFADVTWSMQNFGLVPLSVYSGLNYGENVHAHGEMEAILKAYVDAVVQNENGRLSTAWKRGYDAVLDAYLGAKPETFEYEGKTYTPMSFAKEYCGLNADDYVSVTSFTHHPYYTTFAIEVEDNWLNEMSYNIPLDEFVELCDKALDNGFTFAWGTDCSETGFTRTGLAVAPDMNAQITKGNEAAKWVDMPRAQFTQEMMKNPMPQIQVTPEMRQAGFDNYQTTDDHGMHIIGKAVDQNGTKYFIVKNSWGSDMAYGGYWYATYEFFAHKTINIMIHKDALSAELKAKLGIK